MLASCLEAVEKGHANDREGLVGRYPEFVRELTDFFAQRARVDEFIAPLREVARPGSTAAAAGDGSMPELAGPGSLDRKNRSLLKIAKNFDIRATLRRNLKHYEAEQRRVLIETPFFYSRIRRQVDRWQMIILVDESGSMMNSVIHSAAIPGLRFFAAPSADFVLAFRKAS